MISTKKSGPGLSFASKYRYTKINRMTYVKLWKVLFMKEQGGKFVIDDRSIPKYGAIRR